MYVLLSPCRLSLRDSQEVSLKKWGGRVGPYPRHSFTHTLIHETFTKHLFSARCCVEPRDVEMNDTRFLPSRRSQGKWRIKLKYKTVEKGSGRNMPQMRCSTKDSSSCKESQCVQALTKNAWALIAKRRGEQREDVGRENA